MKVSLLIIDGVKQIILTPESKHEKECLAYISPGSKLETVLKTGTFMGVDELDRYSFSECQGGWYRRYGDSESVAFIIKDTSKETP